MFLPEQLPGLRSKIRAQAARESEVLHALVAQAGAMAPRVRPIRPRTATAVALTAADGGNNSVVFNPFSLQIIRIVDSVGKELFLDVVSPATDIGELSRQHLTEGTALGRLMADMDATHLRELSPILSGRSRTWVEAYRDLCEWATLYDLICHHDFAADTLVVRDGLLRATIFRGDMLVRLGRLLRTSIERQAADNSRRVWLAGLAKKTKVLDTYRLAMSIAGIFDRGSPCFVPVPAALQEMVYQSNTDYIGDGTGQNLGQMFFVRFGPRPGDPVWTADILAWQAADAQAIFGHLQADAAAGFPVPFYPFSLQQADAHSRVGDLDMDIIEDSLVDAVRDLVEPDRASVVDALRMTADVAARRYG